MAEQRDTISPEPASMSILHFLSADTSHHIFSSCFNVCCSTRIRTRPYRAGDKRNVKTRCLFNRTLHKARGCLRDHLRHHVELILFQLPSSLMSGPQSSYGSPRLLSPQDDSLCFYTKMSYKLCGPCAGAPTQLLSTWGSTVQIDCSTAPKRSGFF